MVSKKSIKRGVIKIIKRGKDLSRPENFPELAKHMTKQQLINHISITSPDALTYKVAHKFLRLLHGMSDEDIKHAMGKIVENKKLRHDLRLYYNGDMSSNQIIDKWKEKGIQSKSDVDTLATYGTYEVFNDIDVPRTLKESYREVADVERVLSTGKTPAGQRTFNNNISTEYFNLRRAYKSLIADHKITESEARFELQRYLLDLAAARPEYAALVSYLISGGNITDDFSKVLAAFNGSFGNPGKKESFIKMMRSYLLERSRDPRYKQKRQALKEHLESNKKYNVMREELYNQLKSGARMLPSKYEYINPDVVGTADDNYELYRRKQKRKKIVKRKPIQKVKRVVKRCRCK
jgi:hypothetical protein